MKKLLSFAALAATLALLCLSLASCGGAASVTPGTVTAGGVTYFVADGGAIAFGAVSATVQSEIPEGTPTAKEFAAPIAAEEYFTYNGVMQITGLTAKGKEQGILFAPATATGIAADAFADAPNLKSFVIGSHAVAFNLGNDCFRGAKGLTVYFCCPVASVSAGKTLMANTSGVSFRIVSSQYSNFMNDYTFGEFSDLMEKF